MKNFLTIGEFSKIVNLSVKTLRLYADEDVLRPARIDEKTGYRYYLASQLSEAMRVRRLRDLDVPLAEIAAFLGKRDPNEIREFLERQKAIIRKKLAKSERDLAFLEKLSMEGEAFFLSYEVVLREVKPVKVMSVRSAMTMKNIGEAMHRDFEELVQYIERSGGIRTGECVAVYHGEEFDPNDMDVESCLSVEEFLPRSGRINGRILEGGLMACTLHKGPYDQLEGAYGALAKWVEENGYAFAGAPRDMYLDNPDEVPPAELRTEVLWPVKRRG